MFLPVRYLFLILILFLNRTISFSQNSDDLFREAERIEFQPNEKLALNKYFQLIKLKPDHFSALYKCSELCSRIGSREKDNNTRDDYYNKALYYAKQLVKLNPNSDLSYVAMGIASGRIALTKSGKDKVSYVRDIKRYADMAIKINPESYKAWHILGKWNYEVSNLNFFESLAVEMLFGGLPDASINASIRCYEKARQLKPEFCLNYLELAKAYEKNDQKDMAIAILKKVMLIPNSNEDDPIVKKEASQLLKDLE